MEHEPEVHDEQLNTELDPYNDESWEYHDGGEDNEGRVVQEAHVVLDFEGDIAEDAECDDPEGHDDVEEAEDLGEL